MTQSTLPLGNEETSVLSPLAHILRPKNFADFVGQEKLLPLIKAWIKNPQHLVLWGPAGSGKTTLVHLLAESTKRVVFNLNAVTSGVPDLRKVIQEIKELKDYQGKHSVLFIDEIHRFNKSQQDALLPYLEGGDFLFLGATTEYPQTALNRPLLSRIRTWELGALTQIEINKILKKAMIYLSRLDLETFVERISLQVNGDARLALNILNVLSGFRNDELQELSEQDVFKEIFSQLRQYDKGGNRHYDLISAFIKSMRGSNPDAALLWLAVMLDGGEDPEFIARRMLILASEDIGLANNQALQVATNAHYVVKTIGMPEARITLAHAVIYLSLSPKSNSSYLAINSAMNFVHGHPTIAIPPHLKGQPLGKNYRYPHDDQRAWVEQDYFALDLMPPHKFFEAKNQGMEPKLTEWLHSRRQ